MNKKKSYYQKWRKRVICGNVVLVEEGKKFTVGDQWEESNYCGSYCGWTRKKAIVEDQE